MVPFVNFLEDILLTIYISRMHVGKLNSFRLYVLGKAYTSILLNDLKQTFVTFASYYYKSCLKTISFAWTHGPSRLFQEAC